MWPALLTLVSIALTITLSLATLPYVTGAFLSATAKAEGAGVRSQGYQIAAAMEIYYTHNGEWPTDISQLVEQNYLRSIPIPSVSAISPSVLDLLLPAAIASNQTWYLPKPGSPHLWLYEAVNTGACQVINTSVRGSAEVHEKLDPDTREQCFGRQKPFTYAYTIGNADSSIDLALFAAESRGAVTLLARGEENPIAVTSTGIETTPTASPAASNPDGSPLAATPETLTLGPVLSGTVSENVLTVTNHSAEPVTPGAAQVSGTDLGLVDLCAGTTLVSGSSCQVYVSTTPAAEGPVIATIALASEDTAVTTQVPVSGVAVAPTFALSAETLDFGSVAAGNPVPVVVLITNTSPTPIVLLQATIAGADAGVFTLADGCFAVTLAPGAICAVTVTANPTVPGEFAAVLALTTQVGGGLTQRLVALSGVRHSGIFAVPSASYATNATFGSAFGVVGVGGSTTRYLYIRNIGTSGDLATSFTITGSSAFSVEPLEYEMVSTKGTRGACKDDVLAADRRSGSCRAKDVENGPKPHVRMPIVFAPRTAGVHSAQVIVQHNGVNASPIVVTLTGSATSDVRAVVSALPNAPKSFDGAFGSIKNAGPETRDVYVRNTGIHGALVTDFVVSGSSAFTIDSAVYEIVNNAGSPANCKRQTLSQDQRSGSCTADDASAGGRPHLRLRVRFAPASLGAHTAQLVLHHNGIVAGPIVVPLSGTRK